MSDDKLETIKSSRLLTSDELIPAQIIHFDPVRREIVKPYDPSLILHIDNPSPKFFDIGYVYAPYIPVSC